jgi:hypothetical protein
VSRHGVQRSVGRVFEGATRFALLAFLIAAIAVGRGAFAKGDPRPQSHVGLASGVAAALSPTQLTIAAATALDTAYAKGGAGITFQIVQTSTLRAKAGGPKVDIPDPNSRGSLGFADEYRVGSTIERGANTPDGFWMEMRAGPLAGANPDWTGATYEFGTIVQGGKTYRNDGLGWYPTTSPPGIGLDPATAALLPTLLRNVSNPIDAGTISLGGVSVRAVTAGAKVADVPGIMAIDAKAFTALNDPLDLAFDDQGRFAQLHAVTLNTNEHRYDLVIDTVITFAYPLTADPIPDPTPVWDPTTAAPKG